jgi:signal transduction histidine kinase/HD-like signal output (HDOD) protein
MAASGLQRRKIEVVVEEVDSLPTLPGVAHHLLSLLTAERPVRRDLQLAIEGDAALSARVLRLALAYAPSPDAVTSIDAVFEILPAEVLTADLLSVGTIDPRVAQELNLTRLWRHILATGMAAQVIANRLGTVAPQAALLAGILHDVGQIALVTALPRAYSQVLQQAQSAGSGLLEAERAMLGVDHAVLGRRLARRWGFSETLQSVIWLHHQAQVPDEDPVAAALTQVVRLADIVVRQEGFGYQPSEQLHDGATEAAERLGLSSAAAHQIGRQVASAFDLNARPIGMEQSPAVDEMWPVASAARMQLGRLYHEQHQSAADAKAQAHRADLLLGLNARLAGCGSVQDVFSTVAVNAREALAVGTIVPYLLGRQGEYVEGFLCTADGDEEHFIHGFRKGEGIDALTPHAALAPLTGVPVRAERLESWLFERHGAQLGAGPFYTLAMTAGEARVGGLVFSLRPGAGDLTAAQAGELAALAAVAGVVLKRMQAEADLVSLSEELAEVNRRLQTAERERLQRRNVASLSEMAAGAAHEINNPLAIISGRAQQLAADEKVPARQELLKTIVQQASRISDIIADLRLFARPPAPHLEEVDPAALAREIAGEFLQPPREGGPVLQVEAPEIAPKIRADRAQVGGALREVLKNALEACADGRGATVTLSVQPVAGQAAVRLVVADDGPGMDPQVRARAFDPFYCGRDAGRRRGLGLPKAYQAVLASAGQMTLESEPGQGTTVRMTFAAVEPKP